LPPNDIHVDRDGRFDRQPAVIAVTIFWPVDRAELKFVLPDKAGDRTIGELKIAIDPAVP
jgi:hypothetical protein